MVTMEIEQTRSKSRDGEQLDEVGCVGHKSNEGSRHELYAPWITGDYANFIVETRIKTQH